MPTQQVVDMIFQALGVMAIGIPAVFGVLAVFYLAVRAMMLREDRKNAKEAQEE